MFTFSKPVLLLFHTLVGIFCYAFSIRRDGLLDVNISLFICSVSRLVSIAILHFAITHSGNSKPTSIGLFLFVWHFLKLFGIF